MGGGNYERDVGSASSSGRFPTGGTSSARAKVAMGRSSMHTDTSPYKKKIKSDRKSPIVVALDGTGSNIEFARIVYDKAPMFFGQIEQQGYLSDFDISFCVVGDAYCDKAPLQVCDFAWGIDCDAQLKKLFLEGYGGGQHTETYELAAYYFSKYCDMPNAEMPFMFIIGDEAPYPYLGREIVRAQLGEELQADLETRVVFQSLFKHFKGNVFFLQNAYYGVRDMEPNVTYTEEIKQEWLKCFGYENGQKIRPIHEEKSIVDVILGLIAMTARARDLSGYLVDMGNRDQTSTRIANVRSSLEGFERSLVPVVDAQLPVVTGKRRESGVRRL